MSLDYTDFEEESRLFEGQKKKQVETMDDFDPNEFDEMPTFEKLDGIGRDQDRYIWFGGNVLSSAEKRSRVDLFLGGENFGPDFPALAISKYALMRGRITPITLAPRPHALDEPVVNPTVVHFEGDLKNAGELSRVRHVKAFPGDQLETIVFGARDGSSKGIVELTAFQKLSYQKIETKKLIHNTQNSIFPDWKAWLTREKAMPETLRALENIIAEAADKYRDADRYIEKSCEEMLVGCSVFRDYGIGYLQKEGLRIRAGVNPNGGYVHRYSGVAEQLLIQLEMKRENLLDDKSDLYKDFTPEKIFAMFGQMNQETIRAVFEANKEMITDVLSKKDNNEPVGEFDPEAELKKMLEGYDRDVLIELCKSKNIEFPQKANKLQLWKLLNPSVN